MVIEGVVEMGCQLGRQLGFPTANVALCDDVEIEGGVYASRIEVDGMSYNGVTNIGINPTTGGVKKRSESHIIGFENDIYGKHITIELGQLLRHEQRFESLEALKEQIRRDVEMASAMQDRI